MNKDDKRDCDLEDLEAFFKEEDALWQKQIDEINAATEALDQKIKEVELEEIEMRKAGLI